LTYPLFVLTEMKQKNIEKKVNNTKFLPFVRKKKIERGKSLL